MNQRGAYRDRLEQWLDEPPEGAPHDLLEEILRSYPTVRQRRGRWSWTRGSRSWLMPIAVGASVVLVMLALVLFGPRIVGPNVGGPQPTPGWADRFPSRVATAFAMPFTYAVDPASGMTQRAGDSGSDQYQFRAGEPSDPTVLTKGVVVRTAGDGLRQEPCSETGGAVIRAPTPREFIAYLQTVPGLEVTNRGTASVDGYPALVADVRVSSDRPCNDVWVFENGGFTFVSAANEGTTRRFLALDVDGELVLIVVFAEKNDFERWLPVAQAFIDTIRFGGP